MIMRNLPVALRFPVGDALLFLGIHPPMQVESHFLNLGERYFVELRIVESLVRQEILPFLALDLNVVGPVTDYYIK
jgi:hypothetical protein